ncbi:hypothetical protein [uncultured Methylobacterium sp.]|uniref:hypothetical protein n=1 Tax=uncultured Methylobacterium sp. TaxID=157278 RepID=UPI002594F349|nr:hypothetical protein [uncultured Methylobacterium sp.]
MSIAVLIKQLRDAGAPMEAIEIAVAAVEAERSRFEAADAARRAADEARKADQRARTAKSRAKTNAASSRDGNVTVTPPSRDPSPKDNNQTPTQLIPPVDPDGSTAPKGADDAELPGLVDPVEASAAPAAQPGGETPKAASEPRARRLTADFADSPEARAVCAEMGLTDAEADAALAEFCDYWLAEGGAKARKIDWPRTLRNRLREVSRRRPPPGRPLPRGQPDRSLSPAARRALFLRDLSRGSDAPDDETDPSLDDDGPIIDHEGDGRPDRPLSRSAAGDPRQFPAQGNLRLAGAGRR